MAGPSWERIEVGTPFGPLWFWGPDRGLPVLLLITGAFANPDTLERLPEAIDGVDVWRAHLPGNHCPPLVDASVGLFAAAFSHVLTTRLAHRPVVVCGLSVGGLVALAVRAPNLKRLIAIEPVILTEGVWTLKHVAAEAPPGSEAFLWNILGVRADGRAEPRDYTELLQTLPVPTVVLIGEEPVGAERPFHVQPSMITDAARAAFEACPRIQVGVASGAGHNIPKLATGLFFSAVLGSCQAAFGPQVAGRPVDGDPSEP